MIESWGQQVWPFFLIVLQAIAIIVPILIGVAYLTYAERKVIAAMHLRRGPNVVGPFGLLQPLADGLKLFFKETIIPSGANRVVFIMAPMVTFSREIITKFWIKFRAAVYEQEPRVGRLRRLALSPRQASALRSASCGLR